MNAVRNAAADISIVMPTVHTQSKPVSVSFRDIRESILKSQIADRTPVKEETKDSELAAEQGLTSMTPAVVQGRADVETSSPIDQDVLQAVDALQQQISKCCDFTELTDEIADILEGFGLLKRSGETVELTQEGEALLQNMMNSIMNAEDAQPIVFTVAGNEAGMLNTAIPDDVQQKLQLLIKEYVCSLENANNNAVSTDNSINPGAVSADGTVDTDAVVSTGAVNSNAAVATPDVEDAAIPQKEQAADTAPLQEAAMLTGETDQDRASAAEVAAQKDPLAQLTLALTQARKSAAPEDTVRPQRPTAASDAEPVPFTIGSAFSLRQPVQNAKTDIPFPVVTQADMTENISNIVKELSFRSEEGVQEFSVSLKPEHLGELVIKLTKGPEGLLAQIKAADATTKGLIQNEVATLTEQLKGKGIELRQIEVLYEAPAFTTDMRQNKGHQETAASPYKTRHYRTSGIEESYGTIIDPAVSSPLLSLDSSVEYQA